MAWMSHICELIFIWSFLFIHNLLQQYEKYKPTFSFIIQEDNMTVEIIVSCNLSFVLLIEVSLFPSSLGMVENHLNIIQLCIEYIKISGHLKPNENLVTFPTCLNIYLSGLVMVRGYLAILKLRREVKNVVGHASFLPEPLKERLHHIKSIFHIPLKPLKSRIPKSKHHVPKPKCGESYLRYLPQTLTQWEPEKFFNRSSDWVLTTEVFYASFDQMVVGGYSACSVIAVLIAEWFQFHPGRLPSKERFDMLILEGTLQWKSLCGNPRFKSPDKLYDLETVFKGVKKLRVDKSKSYVGFFDPEGIHYDYVDGALTVDEIWGKLHSVYPKVYIIGFNCHFFVLVAAEDAFYIVDTIGGRLKESCSKGYILKFDKNTLLMPVTGEASERSNGEKKPLPGEICQSYFQKFLSPSKEEVLGQKDPSQIVRSIQVDFYALL